MVDSEILKIQGIGPKVAKTLEDCGYNTIEKIVKAKADELSQLPGVGLATAEKIISGAKDIQAAEKKASAKKPAAKPAAKKPAAKKPIPKPPAKKPVAKPAAKKPVAKPAAKKPVAKPAATKTTEKPIPKPKVVKTEVSDDGPRPSVKEPEEVVAAEVSADIIKPKVTAATQIAIDKAPQQITIKKKRVKSKKKPGKKISLTKTYGVVNNIIHDRAGKTKNRSIVMKLYETEVPLEKYLGRKVTIRIPGSDKQLKGTITKLHGKRSSADKLVVVRFNHGVSPHILTARAQIQ